MHSSSLTVTVDAAAAARAEILQSAKASIERDGIRKMTMSGIAERGGVPKAAIYNHFRSRGDLLDQLLASELATVEEVAERAGQSIAEQLAATALAIAEHPALGAIRRHEPDVLAGMAGLTAAKPTGRWEAVVATVQHRLMSAGARSDEIAVELVLRWLLSIVMAPGTAERLRAEAGLLADAVS